jgi:hypothetical protein
VPSGIRCREPSSASSRGSPARTATCTSSSTTTFRSGTFHPPTPRASSRSWGLRKSSATRRYGGCSPSAHRSTGWCSACERCMTVSSASWDARWSTRPASDFGVSDSTDWRARCSAWGATPTRGGSRTSCARRSKSSCRRLPPSTSGWSHPTATGRQSRSRPVFATRTLGTSSLMELTTPRCCASSTSSSPPGQISSRSSSGSVGSCRTASSSCA